MTSPRILVTGFEPFGGERENASATVARALAVLRDDVVCRILPVAFADAPSALRAAWRELRPDLLVSIGEAGGRDRITPERRARNLAHARIADNAGAQPLDEHLDAGREVIETTVDVARLVAASRAVGVPADVSDDAGSYVCNAVFRAALRDVSPGAVFIHVPAVRSSGRARVGAETDGATRPPGLSADQVVAGVSAMLDELVRLGGLGD